MQRGFATLVVAIAGCAAVKGVVPKQLAGVTSSTSPTSASSATSSGPTVTEDVKSGLETEALLDADPPGFRVSWIKWDSGFRGSDLRVGDRIIAIDGKRFLKPPTIDEVRTMLPKSIGQYAEHQGWAERGARDGTNVKLTVLRRSPKGVGFTAVDVEGKLVAERLYRNAAGKRTIGPDGPEDMASDGFDVAWTAWHEKTSQRWRKILDLGWSKQNITSRVELTEHLEQKKRVDYLVANYRGPFVAQHQGKFFGPISPRIKDELLETREWEERSRNSKTKDLEKFLREWREEGRTFWVIGSSGLSSADKETLRDMIDDRVQELLRVLDETGDLPGRYERDFARDLSEDDLKR